jgi:hypothetical protein
MPRAPGAPGGRTHRICTALSDAEVQDLDDRRGSLNRSEWLRYLIKKAERDNVRFEWTGK